MGVPPPPGAEITVTMHWNGTHLNCTNIFLLDINECEPTNDCMHQCNNTDGNYTCYCNEFFEVDPNDRKSCIRKSYLKV